MSEFMTDTRYISTVIDRGNCPHHGRMVPQGIPCYSWPSLSNRLEMVVGVCNKRAKKAGFNGHIKPTHFATKRGA